jgi:hypothetical protein
MHTDSMKAFLEDDLLKSSDAAWRTHHWTCRRLALEPGKPLLHNRCAECHRDIVDDLSTDERYAVHVSALRFNRLSDEVSGRWLREPCPAVAQPTDNADRMSYIGRTSPSGAAGKTSRTTRAENLQRQGLGGGAKWIRTRSTLREQSDDNLQHAVSEHVDE